MGIPDTAGLGLEDDELQRRAALSNQIAPPTRALTPNPQGAPSVRIAPPSSGAPRDLGMSAPYSESRSDRSLIDNGSAANRVAASPPVRIPGPSANDKTPPLTLRGVSPQLEQRTAADEAEAKRLQETGSGISQIQHGSKEGGIGIAKPHPFLGGALRGLDVLGSIVAPGMMANIPGTELHHQMLGAGSRARLGQDIGEQEKEAATTKDVAQANAANRNDKLTQALLTKGYTLSYDEQGNPALAEVPGFQREKPEPFFDKAGNIIGFQTGEGPLDLNSPKLTPEMKAIAEAAKPKVAPVGDPSAKQYNDSILRELNVNPKTAQKAIPPEYQVLPTDTDAQAKEKFQRAKDLVAGATGQQHITIQTGEHGIEAVVAQTPQGTVYESKATAEAAGHKILNKANPQEVEKGRQAYTQYGRMIDNAQEAMLTMPAWKEGSKDRDFAMRVSKQFFSHIPVVGVDASYVDQFLNSDDYRQMSAQGQTHMQNMFQIWSDAINVVKQETGGVPRGQVFLQKEDAILPHPEKTYDMNVKSLNAFVKRMKKDSAEYPRPVEMQDLQGGIAPPDAQGYINKNGHRIGYVDAQGNRVEF